MLSNMFGLTTNSGGNNTGGEFRLPVSIFIYDGHTKTHILSHSLHLKQDSFHIKARTTITLSGMYKKVHK